jgi:cytochrome c556
MGRLPARSIGAPRLPDLIRAPGRAILESFVAPTAQSVASQTDIPNPVFVSHLEENRKMLRKWLVFTSSASMLVALGVVVGPTFSRAGDDESPLGKVMEQVNKKYNNVKKGTRTLIAFKKSQKDVETSSKELVKLAKEAKELGKDAMKKAKDVAEPEKKWLEYIGAFIKSLENLEKVAATPNAKFADAKNAYNATNKVCTDCHKDFRVDDSSF